MAIIFGEISRALSYHCPIMESRIIGRYHGDKTGPFLICIGGIHGNEPAGILAIKEVLRLLGQEKSHFPDFTYHGTFLGIRGNLEALRQKKRFIDRDLNRMLTHEEIDHFKQKPPELLLQEEKESLELLDLIASAIQEASPSLTLILDLHTTTASGGVFSIAADDEMSLALATGLHIPVILGFASGLKGTTIDYFNNPVENIHCVVFEAGQHEDAESVDRTVSAIINCMRALHAVNSNHVDHRHDSLLISLGKQRHVDGRAPRALTRRANGNGLGVRFARALVPTLADDLLVAREHRADARIRLRAAQTAGSQVQRAAHGGFVERTEFHFRSFGFRLSSASPSSSES